jgi:Gpi18-like mannosyltransferase
MRADNTQSQTDGWDLLKRAAWYAFKLFIALRVGTLLWMFLLSLMGGRDIIEPNVLCRTNDLLHPAGGLSAWLRWDTICYLLIAETGYTVNAGLTVWPPLYPLLIRLFSFVVGTPIAAALLVSSIATWFTFVLLYLLVTEEGHAEETARNTLTLYTLYPVAFFLVAGYTESLFLALVLGSLLLARKGKWGRAGVLAALSMLTRNQGIVLSVVLLWEGWLHYRSAKERNVSDIIKVLFAASTPVLVFWLFSLYVRYGLQGGWPWQTLGFLWGQSTGFPWEGIIGNIKLLLTLPTADDLYWLPTAIPDLILAITIPVVLVLRRHSMRSTYMIFAWLIVLMGLVKLGPDDVLISFSRYMIAVFPFFIIASAIMKNRLGRMSILTFGLLSQAIFMFMFYIWSWAG